MKGELEKKENFFQKFHEACKRNSRENFFWVELRFNNCVNIICERKLKSFSMKFWQIEWTEDVLSVSFLII